MILHFLRTRWRLIALVFILAATAAMLLIPPGGEEIIARSERIFARGDYQAASQALERALKKKPDWHEARAALYKMQVKKEDPLAALPNFLIFLGTEQCPDEETLLRLFSQDPGAQIQARTLLAESASPAVQEFAVRFEVKMGNSTGALGLLDKMDRQSRSTRSLDRLVAGSFEDNSYLAARLEQLLAAEPSRIWPREMLLLHALEKGNPELALQAYENFSRTLPAPEDLAAETFALALDTDPVSALTLAAKSQNPDWIDKALDMAAKRAADSYAFEGDEEALGQALSFLAGDPRAQVIEALHLLPPQEGLDRLLELEALGYVPAWPSDYLDGKINLLRQLGFVDFKYLKFLSTKELPPLALLDLAIECSRTSPEGLRELADFLDGLPLEFNRLDTELLREVAAFAGPPPAVIWQGPLLDFPFFPPRLNLSPDCRWLICAYSGKTAVINLASGEEAIFRAGTGQWLWSPDSKKAAAMAANGGRVFILTFAGGKVQEHAEVGPLNCPPLGWIDNGNLALSKSTTGEMTQVARLSLQSGEVRWLGEPRTGWPTINPRGELVWIVPDGLNLKIESAKEKKTYTGTMFEGYFEECCQFLDWLPGARKLLLKSSMFQSSGGHILDLDTGKFTDIGLPRVYFPGNWADSKSIWVFSSLKELPSSTNFLFKTDLATGKSRYWGITATPLPFMVEGRLPWGEVPFSAVGKVFALANDTGITVYKLP